MDKSSGKYSVGFGSVPNVTASQPLDALASQERIWRRGLREAPPWLVSQGVLFPSFSLFKQLLIPSCVLLLWLFHGSIFQIYIYVNIYISEAQLKYIVWLT